MKRLVACILFIICIFSLVGCTEKTDTPSDSVEPEKIIAVYIGDDVTEVKITHALLGQLTEWSIGGDNIAPLRTWVNGLKYESVTFEEGQTPGDGEGQETYWFELAGGDYPGFDYIICGPANCYLLIEGNWYAVTNPSDPPVEAP